MLQNKVTQLLQLLEYGPGKQRLSSKAYQKVLAALHDWLEYKATNRDQSQALALYALLRPFAPKFDATHLTQDYLYHQLFPKGKASKSYFRKVMSTLSKSIEDYLVQAYVLEEDAERQAFLTKVYHQRGDQSNYIKALEKQIAEVEQKQGKTTTDFLNQALQQRQLYEIQIGRLSREESAAILRAYEQSLNTYYLLEKLILANEWGELQRVSKELRYSPDMLFKESDTEWMLAEIKEGQADFGVFDLYLSHLEQTDASRLRVKKSILDMDYPLGLSDRKRLFIWLLNNSSQRLRTASNQQVIMQEQLELYQFGLEQQLLLNAGHLSTQTYFNVVTLSNLLGQHEFCHSFIQQYTRLLTHDTRSAAENWALAHYYFHTGKLETCLKMVGKAYKKYPAFSLQIRILEVKAHYTLLGQDPSAEGTFLDACLVNALKWAANDQTWSTGLLEAFRAFIKMMQRIRKENGKLQVTDQTRMKLIKALEKSKHIFSRAWLIAQIEAL